MIRTLDIRNEITESGVKYWMISEKLGISPGNLSCKLRRELSSEEKLKIRSIIAKIKVELNELN